MSKKIDAKFIIKSLASSTIWKVNEDFAVNMYLKQFESDFITITKAGYMHEIEVKISKSDFLADFDKQSCGWDSKASKAVTLSAVKSLS